MDEARTHPVSWPQLLSADEKKKAQRFRHEQDRSRYQTAHGALRLLLGEYLQIGPEGIQFTTNEFGKPELTNGQKLQFNLSHSGDVALIAVGSNRRIGVDVEQVRTEPMMEGIAERFFSTGELQALWSLPGPEQIKAFFRCWTRKEAYLKAIGCGISDEDLAAVEVSLAPSDPPAVLRGVTRGDGAGAWTVAHLAPRAGYVGAVVAEGENARVISRIWPGDFASPR